MRKAFATLFGWLFAALGGWFIAGSRKGEQERRLSGLLADTRAERDLRSERAERLAARLSAAEEERDDLALEVTRLAQEAQALRQDAQVMAAELADLRGAVPAPTEASTEASAEARAVVPAVAPAAVPATAAIEPVATDTSDKSGETVRTPRRREPSSLLAVLARFVLGAAVGAVVAWQWLQPADPRLLDLELDSSASTAQAEQHREVAESFDEMVAGAEKEGVRKWLAKYAVPWFDDVDETLTRATDTVTEAEQQTAQVAVVRDLGALLAAVLAVAVLSLGLTSRNRGGRRVAGVAVTLGEIASGLTFGAGLYLVHEEFGVVPTAALGVALLALPYSLLVLGARGLRNAWLGWVLLVLFAGLGALAVLDEDLLAPGVATLVLALLVWLVPVRHRVTKQVGAPEPSARREAAAA